MKNERWIIFFLLNNMVYILTLQVSQLVNRHKNKGNRHKKSSIQSYNLINYNMLIHNSKTEVICCILKVLQNCTN